MPNIGGNQMRASSAGFTLIELIVVITVIAILAAVALPRFINAQQDARAAKVQAIFGSIRAASALAKSRCELDLARGLAAVGQCGNATPQVTMDGQVVDMVNRYPAATLTGIDAAAQISAGNDGLILSGGAGGVCPAGGRAFRVSGAPGTLAGQDTCAACYQPAPANGAPTITVDFSNC